MVDLEIAKELMLKINGEKFKTKVPGIRQWSNDGPFSRQIEFTEIKPGDRYYLDDSGAFAARRWKLIEITYVRSGVYFFVEVNKKKKEEKYMLEGSIAIQTGCLQPLEYIVLEKLKDIVEYVPVCPKTKVIYNQ